MKKDLEGKYFGQLKVIQYIAIQNICVNVDVVILQRYALAI